MLSRLTDILDKTRAGIVEILGEPSYEEDYYDETGDFRDYHYMLYVDESAGIVLSIEFPDSNSEADAFEFYRHEEDF